MSNLYFPQLASGALAQYPIQKTRLARTIKNVLADGSMILFADADGARLIWQLSYTDLSSPDAGALQNFFDACAGPLRAFTFIDPTANMLSSSGDLTAAAWNTSSLIYIAPGPIGPDGTPGVTLTNTGTAAQEISQSFSVPANYQYCLSLYAMSSQPSALRLIRRAGSSQQAGTFPVDTTWSRVVSSGRLNESGNTFTVAISLAPGQQIAVYGLQLEPQPAPSRYRGTQQTGGVYPNAHFGLDQLAIAATGPDLFSTSFTIETAI